MIVMNDLPEDRCSGDFITTYIHLGRVANHYIGLNALVSELNSSISNPKTNSYEKDEKYFNNCRVFYCYTFFFGSLQ
jgi:hypothetical protein